MYVLEQLWREGLSPNERYTRKGGEYHKILLRICDEADRVCEELTEKGKEHFEAYRDAQIELSIVAEREVFIEAFRLGARLVLDIVGEYQGCFWRAGEE
jgi:hypothetical protein